LKVGLTGGRLLKGSINMDEKKDKYQLPHIREIKIIRSLKRKRTVSASLNKGVLSVQAPATIPDQELNRLISKFTERFLKKKLKKELDQKQDLKKLAAKLNRTYFGGQLMIRSIEYSINQNSRLGCCNVKTGRILISHRLAAMPDWVRDYVIIHELAHLVVPNHSKSFQKLIATYPLKERAIGFLMAKGYPEEEVELFNHSDQDE
jgi:predicted metal-dependent hydrolase